MPMLLFDAKTIRENDDGGRERGGEGGGETDELPEQKETWITSLEAARFDKHRVANKEELCTDGETSGCQP